MFVVCWCVSLCWFGVCVLYGVVLFGFVDCVCDVLGGLLFCFVAACFVSCCAYRVDVCCEWCVWCDVLCCVRVVVCVGLLCFLVVCSELWCVVLLCRCVLFLCLMVLM